MADVGILVVAIIGFLIAFTVALRILPPMLSLLTETLRSAISVLTLEVRNSLSQASRLWMEGRSSVGESIAYIGGSVWHMGVGMQVVWTDLVLAAATVAGLISLPYSGSGVHYDLLLGVSCVGSALIFAETTGNLMGWLRTMPFATVERGRIPTFFIAGAGFCASIALLGALALYRSEMIAEQADPTAVATWIHYLPHWILVGMSSVFTIAAALAFSTIETFFVTLAGVACVLAAGVLGMIAVVARLSVLITEFLSRMVESLSDWWKERGIVSEAGRNLFKSLADRLNNLVAVKPRQRPEIIPANTSPAASPVKSPKPATHEIIIPAKAHVTDTKLNEDELVGVGVGVASGRGVDHSKNNHRFEYPG